MRIRTCLTRRDFVTAGAGTLIAALVSASFEPHSFLRRLWLSPQNIGRKLAPNIQGQIVGANSKAGHLLRQRNTAGSFPSPTEQLETEILIVGGGISGLTAAWHLNKVGMKNFMILDLEEELGGNARWGKNEVSAYPWGAHYVPIPAEDSKLMLELLEDLGVIEGWNSVGLPIYKETYLSNDPQERIFASGKWQDGLIPKSELTATDKKQFDDFFKTMAHFRSLRDDTGRRFFSIPIDESSQASPAILELDEISMLEYLQRNSWDSPRLRWYIDYCCKDDYGARADKISAWAGIHYFASRDGKGANTEKGNVLTWPEGNGWVVEKLKDRFPDKLRSSSLVFGVSESEAGSCLKAPRVDFLDLKTGRTTRVSSKAVILATPRFVADRLLGTTKKHPQMQYSPWLVANLTLKQMPDNNSHENRNQEEPLLSWDNVIYDSPSLGYVNAGNQKLERYPHQTVLTYYLPLSHDDPASARREASAKTHSQWTEEIIEDLSIAHPDIRSMVSHIDIWLWGHGMIRPTIGYIWGKDRNKLQKPVGSVFFAHTDMSGISIFEEAQYRGVKAAMEALKHQSINQGKAVRKTHELFYK